MKRKRGKIAEARVSAGSNFCLHEEKTYIEKRERVLMTVVDQSKKKPVMWPHCQCWHYHEGYCNMRELKIRLSVEDIEIVKKIVEMGYLSQDEFCLEDAVLLGIVKQVMLKLDGAK